MTTNIYQCQVCKKQSKFSEVIWDCEAKHLGLTTEEINHYKQLRKDVDENSEIANNKFDEESSSKLSVSVKKLIEFEEIHQVQI